MTDDDRPSIDARLLNDTLTEISLSWAIEESKQAGWLKRAHRLYTGIVQKALPMEPPAGVKLRLSLLELRLRTIQEMQRVFAQSEDEILQQGAQLIQQELDSADDDEGASPPDSEPI